jgi:hypothetical protein
MEDEKRRYKMKVKQLNNEELLHKYAVAFGKLALDPNEISLSLLNDYNLIKNELIERMKIITPTKLTQLLCNENVIINGENKEDVANALLKELGIEPDHKMNLARLVICIDKSSSMGSFERYAGQCFTTWAETVLNQKYKEVKKSFITYSTEANFSNEQDAFNKGKSGGTITSTGLNKVNECINGYDYNVEDTYVFLISDGDNLTSDNERSVRIISDIERKSKMFGYIELNEYNRNSTLMFIFKSQSFKKYIIKQQTDMLEGLKHFFS